MSKIQQNCYVQFFLKNVGIVRAENSGNLKNRLEIEFLREKCFYKMSKIIYL